MVFYCYFNLALDKIYHVEKNKEFIAGKKTKQEILNEFLNNFEGPKGNKDGIITKEEFTDYYTDLSMSIPSDEYFVGLIESVWMIVEKEDTVAYKEQLNQLVKSVYVKLIEFMPVYDEKMVLKLFKEFNKSKSGAITIDEMISMLTRLCISAERKYMTDLFKKFDANKSGAIEFDEFGVFLKSPPL